MWVNVVDRKALKPTSQKLSINKDEIRACYAQGEEAVIALVESLVERINALEARLSWVYGGNVAIAEFSPSLNFNIWWLNWWKFDH